MDNVNQKAKQASLWNRKHIDNMAVAQILKCSYLHDLELLLPVVGHAVFKGAAEWPRLLLFQKMDWLLCFECHTLQHWVGGLHRVLLDSSTFCQPLEIFNVNVLTELSNE